MLFIIIIGDMGKCGCVCFDVHVEVNFIKLVLSLHLSVSFGNGTWVSKLA